MMLVNPNTHLLTFYATENISNVYSLMQFKYISLKKTYLNFFQEIIYNAHKRHTMVTCDLNFVYIKSGQATIW